MISVGGRGGARRHTSTCNLYTVKVNVPTVIGRSCLDRRQRFVIGPTTVATTVDHARGSQCEAAKAVISADGVMDIAKIQSTARHNSAF